MGPDGQEVPVEMGSYGIGVSAGRRPDRSLPRRRRHHLAGAGSAVQGRPDQSARRRCRVRCRDERIATELERGSVEVLVDDRDENAGAKFATMDLIGPWQVVVGRAASGRAWSSSSSAPRASARAVAEAASRGLRPDVQRSRAADRRPLSPRRQEGFVSVIAAFSFLGIMLGVGTLIVVLAVMSGFRAELLGRCSASTATSRCRPAQGHRRVRRSRRAPALDRRRGLGHTPGHRPGDGHRQRGRIRRSGPGHQTGWT